jgi:hypothetical protein
MSVIGKISRKEAYLISIKVVKDNKSKEESINEVCPHLKDVELMPWDLLIVDTMIKDTTRFINLVNVSGTKLDEINFELLANDIEDISAPKAYEMVANFMDK